MAQKNWEQKRARKAKKIGMNLSLNELKDYLMSDKISNKKKLAIKKWLSLKEIENDKNWQVIPKLFTSRPFEVAKASLFRKGSPYVFNNAVKQSDVYDNNGHRIEGAEPMKCTQQLYYNVDEYSMNEILCAVIDEYKVISAGYYKAIERAKKINPRAQSLTEMVEALEEGAV